MAGIQLTGADACLLDMSGAMHTATVEEINVPVFIDEYLQQSTPSSTASTEAAETNTNNYNSNGNGFCIEDDGIFQTFEFDIDMIADHREAGEEDKQMYCNNMQSSVSSDNNDNNNMNSYGFDNSPCSYSINNSSNNNNNNSAIDNLKTEVEVEDKLSQQFWILPNYESGLDLDLSEMPGHMLVEQAVDINQYSNEESFRELFTHSQDNPLLSETIARSANNSQILFTNAEPFVPEFDEMNTAECCQAIKMEIDSSTKVCESRFPAKKLHLNITPNNTQKDVLATPEILELILQNQEPNLFDEINAESVDSSFFNLTNVSSPSDVYENEPPTPQSSVSSFTNLTNQTGEFTTSPNSPALSVNSSTIAAKKKRGRPSKPYSDRPSETILKNLAPNDRKRLLDRAKNNDASRLSREKNKKRMEAQVQEEQQLEAKNEELKRTVNKLKKEEEELKRRLFQRHGMS